MAQNYRQPGKRLLYKNSTGSVIPAGTPVAFGTTRIGVAVNDIPAGGEDVIQLAGVWVLPCTLSGEVTRGTPLYLTSDGKITETALSNTPAGIAAYDAASSATEIEVLLG